MTDTLADMKRLSIETAEASHRLGYCNAINDVIALIKITDGVLTAQQAAALLDTMKPSMAVEAMKKEAGITWAK